MATSHRERLQIGSSSTPGICRAASAVSAAPANDGPVRRVTAAAVAAVGRRSRLAGTRPRRGFR